MEGTYTVEKGCKYNAEVVYGDTDSVMVNFGAPTGAEAMPIAMEAPRICGESSVWRPISGHAARHSRLVSDMLVAQPFSQLP